MIWAEVVVALLALVVLAAAHVAFWARWYRAAQQDELRFAPTRDGWEIALARRKPRAAARLPPVLPCHGLAANRANLDFGLDLSLYLAQSAFDCFAMDLRGHGSSRRARKDAPRRWSFNSYLNEDIPAAAAVMSSAARPTPSSARMRSPSAKSRNPRRLRAKRVTLKVPAFSRPGVAEVRLPGSPLDA